MSANSSQASANSVVISIAPNGARKTRQDHPHIPISPDELAYETKACVEHGATMLHLHVRDNDCKHSIDTERYSNAIAAVKKEVGDNVVIQVTSEACGIFSPEEQMHMVDTLKPEAVSIAIRELVPSTEYEKTFAEFLLRNYNDNVFPQFILYDAEDLLKFNSLVERGIIPADKYCVLFVLGRYSKGQLSAPSDLIPFLATLEGLPIKDKTSWFVCAFGPQENQCMLSSALLGGNVRIGFENNMLLADGKQANNNAELVAQFNQSLTQARQTIGTIEAAREVFFCR
jgi:uncharacterized protein (DUF849 family)